MTECKYYNLRPLGQFFGLKHQSEFERVSTLGALRGWLLAKRAYGDTSLIVELFTLEQGRVDFMAKGGRKNSLLEPFRPLWVGTSGRGSLPYLQKVEPSGAMLGLTGDALWCAFYVNELVSRLLPQGMPSMALFSSYGQALQHLAESQLPLSLQKALRQFELALLAECGYAPDLTVDALGNALVEHQAYQLVDNQLMPNDSGYSGAVLLAWARNEWTPSIAKTAKQLTRQVLDQVLGGKPLKSRDMFYSLKRVATSHSVKEGSNE